jgi:hypothetical protein
MLDCEQNNAFYGLKSSTVCCLLLGLSLNALHVLCFSWYLIYFSLKKFMFFFSFDFFFQFKSLSGLVLGLTLVFDSVHG